MQKYILLVTMLFVGFSAHARTDLGLLFGLRLNDGDSRTVGTSVDSKTTFQLGGLAFFPFSENLSVRTGFIYEARNFELKSTGASQTAKFAHFDIPLTVMFGIEDFGGVFAGPGLALKVSDSCGPGDCDGAKSTIMPIMFGGHFKVAPQVALEFYYETVMGNLYDEVKDPTAVVLNALVTFD